MVHKSLFSKVILLKNLFYIFFLVFFGCNDNPLKIGIELLPEDDLLDYGIDTLEVSTFTVTNPSLPAFWKTSETTTRNCPIGYVIDPIFGELKAEASISFLPEATIFRHNEKRDSYKLKLHLELDESFNYGNADNLYFDVYEIYYSLSTTGRSDYVLKSDDYNPDPINVDQGNYCINDSKDTATIDIELSEEFALRVVDSILITEDSIYVNANNFYEHFKGIHIKATRKEGDGRIISLEPINSYIVLTYRDSSQVLQDSYGNDSIVDYTDSLVYDLYAISSLHYHAHSTSNIPNLNDTINQAENIYIQSLAGTQAQLNFSNLKNYVEQYPDLVINKAEVILPLSPEGIDTTYNRPEFLGIGANPGDYGTSNNNQLVGILNTEREEYRINITQYVHDLLNGNTEVYKLYLYSTEITSSGQTYYYNPTMSTPQRVILNSGLNQNPVILRIIYSKILNL